MRSNHLNEAAKSMSSYSSSLIEQLVRSNATKYIPLVMSIVTQIPSFLFGFVITMFFLVCFTGRPNFRLYFEPVMGFHLFAMFILGEIVTSWQRGRAVAAARRKEIDETIHFDQDILMRYNVKPD